MNKVSCPVCGAPMVKNGHTSAGAQRWRCNVCKRTITKRNLTISKDFDAFSTWLLTSKKQKDMAGAGSTFRRRCKKFWDLWPIAPVIDSHFDVLYADGIYLRKAQVVILIVCARGQQVLGWYAAKAESEDAWLKVLSRIQPPSMVIADGGAGFLKAAKRAWPNTMVQRCHWHLMAQIVRATTRYPCTEVAKELKALADSLPKVVTAQGANEWIERFDSWCESYKLDLSVNEAELGIKRKKMMRSIRRLIKDLICDNTLFNYLLIQTDQDINSLRYNNYIEGAINSSIRAMWRNHRGQSVIRRIKAAYWFCHMHCPDAPQIQRALEVYPTDEMIQDGMHPKKNTTGFAGAPDEWGQAVVWDEFHLRIFYFYFDE